MSDIINVDGQPERDICAELALLPADILRLADDLSRFVERPRGGVATLATDLVTRIRQKPIAAIMIAAAAGYCVLKPWTALAFGAAYFARRAAPAFLGPHSPSTSDVRPSWEYWPGR
jgi:hypothetical protein